MPGYERLSVIDRTFLDMEGPSYHQHVAATLVFEPGPLRLPHGGIDADRIREHVGDRLHRIPRYRQRLAWIPIEGHPVWVDDDSFNLEYHVRHTSLPAPGDEQQLQRLAARIMSQKLDRGKPLWEVWVVEGLLGGRFAVITKTHHCMVDGIAGVDLMTVLLSPTPDESSEPRGAWLPEKPPGVLALGLHEAGRRLATPLRLAGLAASALRSPRESTAFVRERLAALGETLSAGLRAASDTPLNRPLGPHRRFEWTSFDLAPLKQVKNALGGTVNDVVLAVVAGALSRFLAQRGISAQKQAALDVRAMVPVSVRAASERGSTGNQIALWTVPLPLAVPDPRQRLASVREVTERLKHSKQAEGAAVLAAVSEWTVPNLLSLASRAAYRFRAANLVVTNVPGPQIPLYMLGARLLAAYPMLNLLTQQSLGVALLSYAGRLHWGFMADLDLLPDLHDFALAIEDAFQELADAAGVDAQPAARARRSNGEDAGAEA
jgi:WS/DGAT/MGAT family acyltransferase